MGGLASFLMQSSACIRKLTNSLKGLVFSNNNMNIKETIISGIVLLFLIAGGVYLGNSFKESKVNPIKVGSISSGGGYNATSTATGSFAALQMLTPTPTTTQGILGSVTLTGAATGQIYIWDATTSDITQRAASMSSSTQLITSFPASTAAGTYVYDAVFKYGLLVQVVGTAPTSTITWKY